MSSKDTTKSSKKSPQKALEARADSKVIEKSFVSDKTVLTYVEKICGFGTWLFQNHQKYINPAFLQEMKDADATDHREFEKKSKKREAQIENNKKIIEKIQEDIQNNNRSSSKASKRKIVDPPDVTFEGKNLRKVWKKKISEMVPRNKVGEDHKSPIIIEGEGMITYELIRDYMSTKKNEVYVEKAAAHEYMKEISKDISDDPIVIDDDDVNEEGFVKCLVHQSSSQYSGIRSGISYVYKLANLPFPTELSRNLSKYISGIDRTIVKAKEKLGLSITEGKKPMSEDAFEELAGVLFRSDRKSDIFAHLFLVLDW